MEKKQYRLKRDISAPASFVNAGAIFTKTGIGDNGAYTLPNGQYPLHPKYVEDNDAWFDPIHPVKEWPKGIDWFKGDSEESAWATIMLYGYNAWVEVNMDKGRPIHRVRNSSGEVFSVGDEVQMSSRRIFTITKFEVESDYIFAHSSNGSVGIDFITHTTTPITATQLSAAIENFKKELGVK